MNESDCHKQEYLEYLSKNIILMSDKNNYYYMYCYTQDLTHSCTHTHENS